MLSLLRACGLSTAIHYDDSLLNSLITYNDYLIFCHVNDPPKMRYRPELGSPAVIHFWPLLIAHSWKKESNFYRCQCLIRLAFKLQSCRSSILVSCSSLCLSNLSNLACMDSISLAVKQFCSRGLTLGSFPSRMSSLLSSAVYVWGGNCPSEPRSLTD